MSKKRFLLLGLLAALFSFAQEAAVFSNPFIGVSSAFYFVHEGGPLKLSISFKTEKPGRKGLPGDLGERGAYVASIYDHEERRVEWRYAHVEKEGSNELSHDFGANAPAGIYQIRYSGLNLLVSVEAVPKKQFGFMPLRAPINGYNHAQFANAYFYIPDNAEKMSVYTYNQKPVITDENGVQIQDLKKIDLTAHRGKVWNLKTKGMAGYFNEMGFNEVPIILCPDEKTAMAIHGSLEKTEDGKYFPHKYQVRMYEWCRTAAKESLAVDIVPIKQFLPELEKDPVALGLVGGYGWIHYINDVIRTQNIDPASPQFCQWHLDQRVFDYSDMLAVALGLGKPYNPYYRNAAIERRLLLTVFQAAMKCKENDSYSEGVSMYSGGDGLCFVRSIGPFLNSYQAISDRYAADLYADSIRRTTDRWSMFRVSCDNQSSHWPFIQYNVYLATGIEGYREMAKDFIYGMSREGGDRFMKTGYQQESYGPDGTYQGLGTCYQAAYYRWTGDPVARRTLQIIYDLFNHTVAPEPDGRVFGFSSYGHRTAGSWVNRQYGGGLQLMKGELPEAAVWYRHEKKRDLRKDFNYTGERKAGWHGGSIYATHVIAPFFSEFRFPSETLPGAKFPVESSSNFTKNFNNEFYAVRRPAYYAVGYTGKTSSAWCGKARTTRAAGNGDNKWWVSQGFGLLWFQDFGNVITAMNWNAGTGYFVRVDFNEKECAYPDYFSFEGGMPDDSSFNTRTGYFAMEGMTVTRNFKFIEKGVQVSLHVTFDKDGKAADVYEQIPLLNYNKRSFAFRKGGQWQEAPCKTDEVLIGGKVSIKLDRKMDCDFGADSSMRGQTIHPLRIHLGREIKAGTSIDLTYVIAK